MWTSHLFIVAAIPTVSVPTSAPEHPVPVTSTSDPVTHPLLQSPQWLPLPLGFTLSSGNTSSLPHLLLSHLTLPSSAAPCTACHPRLDKRPHACLLQSFPSSKESFKVRLKCISFRKPFLSPFYHPTPVWGGTVPPCSYCTIYLPISHLGPAMCVYIAAAFTGCHKL